MSFFESVGRFTIQQVAYVGGLSIQFWKGIRSSWRANPFTGSSRVQMVSRPQADRRAVVNPGSAGWNYFVDNSIDPPLVVFYANCEHLTTAPDADGGTLKANEL